MSTLNQRQLALLISQPHTCSYLPDEQSAMLFVDPEQTIDKAIYTQLVQQGFRRSGDLIYRPHCPQCSACIPARVPVDRFMPNRNQKRVWRKNQDLDIRIIEPEFYDEHFDLYCRYQGARHAGGGMDDMDADKYHAFIVANHVDGLFYEIRLNNKLAAVAVVDRLSDGLSAVYTYFDPELSSRSLGNFAVLLEIDEAFKQHLQWLYLGYWIKDCQKMTYKNTYRPLQILQDNQWLDYDDIVFD